LFAYPFAVDAVDLSDQLPTDLKKTQKVIKKIPPQVSRGQAAPSGDQRLAK